MGEYIQYLQFTNHDFALFCSFKPYIIVDLTLSQPGNTVWDSSFTPTLTN